MGANYPFDTVFAIVTWFAQLLNKHLRLTVTVTIGNITIDNVNVFNRRELTTL